MIQTTMVGAEVGPVKPLRMVGHPTRASFWVEDSFAAPSADVGGHRDFTERFCLPRTLPVIFPVLWVSHVNPLRTTTRTKKPKSISSHPTMTNRNGSRSQAYVFV